MQHRKGRSPSTTLLRLSVSLLFLTLLTGCFFNLGLPAFTEDQSVFSDEELWEAAYSRYRYPDHFFEEHARTSVYYESNISIGPLGEPPYRAKELCTESRSQALEWSETASSRRAYYRNLTGERETEKFFEFRRQAGESDILLSRVHKCSYVEMLPVPLSWMPGTNSTARTIFAVFNQRPLNRTSVKELIEYLGYRRSGMLGGNRVLSSFSEELDGLIRHTIYAIWLGIADWNTCDKIILQRTVYEVNKTSGEVSRMWKTLRELQGECR